MIQGRGPPGGLDSRIHERNFSFSRIHEREKTFSRIHERLFRIFTNPWQTFDSHHNFMRLTYLGSMLSLHMYQRFTRAAASNLG